MIIKKLKNWMGIPLAFGIFGVYAIQRGLITLSRTDMVPVWFKEGLDIYFIMMILGMIIAGPLLDKINSRGAILIGTILGVVGLATLGFGPWGFGLLFGACAVLFKIASYSSPMKVFDGGEAYKIVPQAAAKNFGGGLFILILGSLLASLSWGTSTVILATFFGISGIVAYLSIPDDKVEGWKVNIFKELALQWRFWLLMLYFFAMAGLSYLLWSYFIPAMLASGLSKASALTIVGTSYLLSGVLRLPSAWLGEKIGHITVITIGTLGLLVSIPLVYAIPVTITYISSAFGAMHTPNYWPLLKHWGKPYVATMGAMAYISMWIGIGVIYGRW